MYSVCLGKIGITHWKW